MTARNPRSISNRRMKDRKRRTALRAKLRAEGMAEPLIDEIIDRQRHDDLINRVGLDKARAIRSTGAPPDPDDAGYKPSAGDPLLRGPARVGGITAKVVGRQNTITRFQYAREVEKENR